MELMNVFGISRTVKGASYVDRANLVNMGQKLLQNWRKS